jgi:cell wall-associated NlpC family hydrolase
VRGVVVGLAKRVMCKVVPAVVVALVTLLLNPYQVVAQQPTTAAGLLAHYQDLSREAAKVGEQLLLVHEDVAAKRRAAAEASGRATAAKAAAEKARGTAQAAREDMDRLAVLLSGHRTRGGLSALTTSASRDEVLAKLEAASLAAQVTGQTVEHGDDVVAEADRAAGEAARAQDEARAAEATVANAARQVEQQKAELDRQVAEVRATLDRLPPDVRSLLSTSEYSGADVAVPSGDVGAVVRFVLAQLGKPYVWGATGPNSYDCSGLMQTAFRTAGVSIPRVSIQQSAVGRQVGRNEVRPADLIFFYQPVSHVAIAVDDVRAVHAPTFGQTVKISNIDNIGPITVIRRMMQ